MCDTVNPVTARLDVVAIALLFDDKCPEATFNKSLIGFEFALPMNLSGH